MAGQEAQLSAVGCALISGELAALCDAGTNASSGKFTGTSSCFTYEHRHQRGEAIGCLITIGYKMSHTRRSWSLALSFLLQ